MKQKVSFIFLIISILFAQSSFAQTYEEQYKMCSASLSKLGHVDSLYFVLAQRRDSCMLGASAPDFQATTMDHKRIELSKLKGQVIFINFWFTNCQPCLEEMPYFNKLAKFYAGKKVKFIAITFDSSAVVKKFLKRHRFNFNLVTDNNNIMSKVFKLFSVWPYTIIIDKKGKIRYMQFSAYDTETFRFYSKIINRLL